MTLRPAAGLGTLIRSLVARRMAFAMLGLMVSTAALILLAQFLDLSQAVASLRGANLAFAAVAVGTLAVSIVIRTARWQVLLPAGARVVSLPLVLPVVLVGYLGNSVAPLRLGDVLRAGIAARRFGLRTTEVLGSVIGERLVDTAALALVIIGAVLSLSGPAWLLQAGSITVAACGLAMIGVHMIPSRGGLSILRLESLRARVPSLTHHIGRILRGVRAPPLRLGAALGLSLLAWLIDGVTFWLCARSLGLDLSWSITLVVAASAALGMAAPSGPAAIGTFELAGTAAAVNLGVPAESALALVILGHAVTVLPLTIAGSISLMMLQLGPRARRRARIEACDSFRRAGAAEAEH